MGYALGIDLGTTFSAAAVVADDGVAQLINLGGRAPAMPSVVLPRAEGTVLFGDAAEARAGVDPTRVAREFKRRLGDPTPLLLGGAPFTAQTLTAMLARHILEQVTARQGAEPDSVVVTHPASYSEFRRDALRTALSEAGAPDVVLIAEPLAAAAQYAAKARLDEGDVVAIYDFGGGTFDVALVRRRGAAFEMVGEPIGLDHLGGSDFDVALLQHLDDNLHGALEASDVADPAVLGALTTVRRSVRDAKEALSYDQDAVVPVHLPGVSANVTITRKEFEKLIASRIPETVAALRRAAASAGLELSAVDRIVLVGGSSHIPAIRRVVAVESGRPLAEDIDAEYAVALGAARLAAGAASGTSPAPASAPAAAPFGAPSVVAATRGSATVAPGWRRPRVLIGALIGAAVLVTVGIAFAVSGDEPESTDATSVTSSTIDATASVDSTDADADVSPTPDETGDPTSTDQLADESSTTITTTPSAGDTTIASAVDPASASTTSIAPDTTVALAAPAAEGAATTAPRTTTKPATTTSTPVTTAPPTTVAPVSASTTAAPTTVVAPPAETEAPNLVEVPNVVTKDFGQADGILRAAGLSITTSGKTTDCSDPSADTVISQSPPAGRMVDRGTPVAVLRCSF